MFLSYISDEFVAVLTWKGASDSVESEISPSAVVAQNVRDVVECNLTRSTLRKLRGGQRKKDGPNGDE